MSHKSRRDLAQSYRERCPLRSCGPFARTAASRSSPAGLGSRRGSWRGVRRGPFRRAGGEADARAAAAALERENDALWAAAEELRRDNDALRCGSDDFAAQLDTLAVIAKTRRASPARSPASAGAAGPLAQADTPDGAGAGSGAGGGGGRRGGGDVAVGVTGLPEKLWRAVDDRVI